jgi:periplasmic divalent cation tolerance protein
LGNEEVVYITAPDLNTAKVIAKHLVEGRLAACVNIIPSVTSIYRWENAIHSEQEVLLLCKTKAEHFEALEREVNRLHPYKTPEIISTSISNGSAKYLEWIQQETGSHLKTEGSAE